MAACVAACLGDADQLVEEDLASLLVGVGAVRRSRGILARLTVPSGHPLDALGRLVLVHIEPNAVRVDVVVWNALRGARARQGVPDRRPALVLALLALPVRLVPAQVAGDGQGLHLTADDEAVLVVDVLADRRRAAAGVVGDEGAKLPLVRVPELPGVLHRDLVPLDPVDLVLAGCGNDDLIVKVPEDTGKIRSIDIL